MSRKKGKWKNPDITKAMFLEELASQNGNCYRAYTNLGLPYNRYYAWRKEDPEFDEACEKAQKAMVKFAEDKMFELIGEGDRHMIKFYLNCKGGYSEKKQIDVNSSNTVDINAALNDIKNELAGGD